MNCLKLCGHCLFPQISHTRKLGEVLVFRAVLVGILVGTLVRILNEIFVETFITDIVWLAILDIAGKIVGILSGILVEILISWLGIKFYRYIKSMARILVFVNNPRNSYISFK